MARKDIAKTKGFRFSKAQRAALERIQSDAQAKISRALQRARCKATVTSFVKNEAEVAAKLRDRSANSMNETLSTISDFDDLLFYRVLVTSEEAVDRATDEIEHLFQHRNTFRRDIPNESGPDFRCHDVMLRYPRSVNPDDALGTTGLRVRVESEALERFEEQIEADRRDAAQLIADEERRAQIKRQIRSAAQGAPRFTVRSARFRYLEQGAEDDIRERKALTKERCTALVALCATRGNEHPRLLQIAERYAKALRALRKDRGAYRLFLSGSDLESYVRIASAVPRDADRNPPLDSDLLHTIETLIVSHAGLLALFPEARQVAAELDGYRENATAVDALRSRLFDPALAWLATSRDLLDEDTAAITGEILDLGKDAPVETPRKGEQAIKHGWLRGILGTFGQRLLAQAKAVGREARSMAVRKGLDVAWQNRDALTSAVVRFLTLARDELMHLASKLPASFGWLKAFYEWLGL